MSLAKLNHLLAEVAKSNAFYQKKLAESGLRLPLSDLSQFTTAFPFTEKAELVADQAANGPYGTNLTYDLSQYHRYHQTSGTSGGVPMRWLDTQQSWSWMVDNWVRVYQEAGTTADDRIFFAFSFGPFLGFWTAFDAGARLGALCIPGGGMNSLGRLQTLVANEVTTLCCTPTYALRLGEVAQEEGVDVGCVKRIIVAGEPGGGLPETRTRIEQLWSGGKVYDHHGMTEVGPVSYTTEQLPDTLCIIESSYIAEIVDDQLCAVAPGEIGELVLTTLGRLGSPLIRYRTGDLVRRHTEEPLSCYRLPGGILGRRDDMILVRGVNLYPSAVERLVRSFSEVAEFRVTVTTQRDMVELRLEIEPFDDCEDPQALSKRIADKFQAMMNLRMKVTVVPSLPRFEMKAKRWVKEG